MEACFEASSLAACVLDPAFGRSPKQIALMLAPITLRAHVPGNTLSVWSLTMLTIGLNNTSSRRLPAELGTKPSQKASIMLQNIAFGHSFAMASNSSACASTCYRQSGGPLDVNSLCSSASFLLFVSFSTAANCILSHIFRGWP